MRALTARPATGALLVFLLTLAIQGVLHIQYRDDPYRGTLVSDSLSYDRLAREWAENGLSATGPFHQSPLFPLLLAQVRQTDKSEGTPDGILWIQYVLTSLALALLVPIGRFAFGFTRAGILAAAIAFLHGPILYHSLKLLPVALALSTQATALLLLTMARNRRSIPLLALAGFAAGIAAVARAEFLLFLVAAAALVFLDRRKVAPPAVYLACALVMVAPVTLHNVFHGDPVLIATAGGENLFIGNQRGGDGGHTALDPHAGDLFSQRTVAREIAEKAEGKPLRPSQVSAYWRNRAIREVLADPAGWLLLEGKKLARAFDPGDPSDMYSLPLERERYLPALSLLFLPAGFLGACGLFGVLAGWKEQRKTAAPLFLFAGIHLVVLLIFFVSTRLRLPFYLGLAMFAGYGLDRLFVRLRSRSRRKPALAVATILVLATVLGAARTRPSSLDRVRLAAVLSSRGELAQGLAVLEPELKQPEPDPIALDQAGWILQQQGDNEGAERWYRQALGEGGAGPALDGFRAVQTRSRLAAVLERAGRLQEARAEHDKAVASRFAVAGTWYERGRFLLRRGDRAGAARDLARARRLSAGGETN